ncbi:MAG: sigma 54-interacting transcriptional regulator [Alphaproteobacteria bacterium]|nr:sigma 54-interacting transcriptional regulator [Alphaproteobacteria bacterium]
MEDALFRPKRRSGACLPPGVIGSSPGLCRAYDLARRVAPSRWSVLILGETGTGKEALARTVHAVSGRTGAFVKVNCANLDGGTTGSTLFGHERGAFTGAVHRHLGIFEQAHGGTLFLDEIGEMPLRTQAALLRVMENGVLRRVGGRQEVQVDVRVVAATHRDLERHRDTGQLREDFYCRLARLPIRLPPLHERGHDVLLIARDWLVRVPAESGLPPCTLDESAERWLLGRRLNGNVRTLQHLLARAALQSQGAPITAAMLSHAAGRGLSASPPVGSGPILRWLQDEGPASVATLARAFDLSPSTVLRRLKELRAQGLVRQLRRGRLTLYASTETATTVSPLGERERRVLQLALEKGSVTRGDVLARETVAPRTATRILVRLAGRGLLMMNGRGGSARRYRVTEEGRGAVEGRRYEFEPDI